MSFLVTAIFFIIIAVVFLPQLTNLVNTLFKSQKEKDQDSRDEKRKADEGLLTQITRLFAGNNAVDRAQSSKKDRDFQKAANQQKERNAKNAGFKSVRQFEIATDPNRDVTKFNPKGIIGFGISSLNGGKGISDTPQNREKLKGLSVIKVIPRSSSGGRRRGVR